MLVSQANGRELVLRGVALHQQDATDQEGFQKRSPPPPPHTHTHTHTPTPTLHTLTYVVDLETNVTNFGVLGVECLGIKHYIIWNVLYQTFQTAVVWVKFLNWLRC